MNDIDASDVQVISAEPERIRVSVFGGRTQLDIRLPVDLPVSSFIPDLAKLVRSRDVPLDEAHRDCVTGHAVEDAIDSYRWL